MAVKRYALLLLALHAAARAEEPMPRPNIVLIVADDLGYSDLGCHGGADIATPHIDSLARGGVRCTNAYVSCPVCAPTRAGLLTGRYQQRFGLELNPGPAQSAAADYGLPRAERTLAERLKEMGYRTGMVGKWHLGYREGARPTDRGFDEFFGFLGGAHSYVDGRDGANPVMRGTTPVEEAEYLTDAFGREAAAFVGRHGDAAQPFFLYLPFNAVHTPLQATARWEERSAGIANPRRRTYAAMLVAMDDAVGRVLGKIRECGLEERTLVLFLSDNGGPTRQTTASNAPLRGFKGQVYEGGIRVPFLLQWKGRLPAGATYDRPVIALDLAPTALAAAGAAPVEGLDGKDLLPHLTGRRAEPPHDVLFWRFGEQSAVRLGDWKLVVRGATKELFDLAADTGEAHDLAAEHPAKVKRLEEAYARWDAELVPPKWRRAARRRRAAAPDDRVRRAFAELDRDGDGRLTPAELGDEVLFRELDRDGDGSLTPREMERHYRSAGD